MGPHQDQKQDHIRTRNRTTFVFLLSTETNQHNTLVVPNVTRPVQDPLSDLQLNNRLYILFPYNFYQVETQVLDPYLPQFCYVMYEQPLSYKKKKVHNLIYLGGHFTDNKKVHLNSYVNVLQLNPQYVVGSRGASQLGGCLLGTPPGYKANKLQSH